MLYHSDKDVQRATGLKLSRQQADAIARLGSGERRVNSRTFVVLRRLGLVTSEVTVGPRGGRRFAVILTEAGKKIRRYLNDQAELGTDYTEQGRLQGVSPWDLYEADKAKEGR